MAKDKTQTELAIIRNEINNFIDKNGFPHDFINRTVGLSGKDKITIPLTKKECLRVNHPVQSKLIELLDAHDMETHWAMSYAMRYLTREPERSIFHSIVEERARLQQAKQSTNLDTKLQTVTKDFYSSDKELHSTTNESLLLSDSQNKGPSLSERVRQPKKAPENKPLNKPKPH